MAGRKRRHRTWCDHKGVRAYGDSHVLAAVQSMVGRREPREDF